MRIARFIALFFIAPPGAILFSPPARAADPFVVLAYNVENWLAPAQPGEIRRGPATKPEREKSAAVSIIAARRPAVVGVVEIGSREALEDLRARLREAGLDYPHAEWHEGLDPDRRVALLSRFPIVSRDSRGSVPFDLAGQPQGIQRGILDVTIEPAPGYRLRLLGLHLKSRRPEPGVDQAALRAKEAWFVHQYIAGILADAPKTRLLLFGDLNDTKDQYPVRQILGAGTLARLADVAVTDSRGERWTHYFKAADEYARVDYFLASAALSPEIDRRRSGIDDSPEWSVASDHRAIFLTITPPKK